jgi:hypothetical protein
VLPVLLLLLQWQELLLLLLLLPLLLLLLRVRRAGLPSLRGGQGGTRCWGVAHWACGSTEMPALLQLAVLQQLPVACRDQGRAPHPPGASSRAAAVLLQLLLQQLLLQQLLEVRRGAGPCCGGDFWRTRTLIHMELLLLLRH